jgi:hypothetical protein
VTPFARLNGFEVYVMSRIRRRGTVALAGMVAFGLVFLGGCAGYNTWPPSPGSSGIANPNARPADQVMLASLQYVVARYPVEGDQHYVVNLPKGLNPRLYKWIVDRVGEGAEPLTIDNKDLPIFHLKQFKIRGSDAEVLILRPVTEAGTGPEGPAYQPITVMLHGGLDGWRVVHRREWAVGLEDPPVKNFWEPPQTTAGVPDEHQ